METQMWIFLLLGCIASAVSGLSNKVILEEVTCEEDYEPTGLHVWIGDAPDCQADTSLCAHFDLNYVCTKPIGANVDLCANGTQVLCEAKPAIPLLEPTDTTTLKVLAYNILELNYIYWQQGQRERTCRIPYRMFEAVGDVDVILFQELFMGGCFPDDISFHDLLDMHGFVYQTAMVGVDARQSDILRFEHGGIFIASRWPIIEEDEYVFVSTDRSDTDVFASKGIAYAAIEKDVGGIKRNYHLFATHMQSRDGGTREQVRIIQSMEFRLFFNKLNIPTDEPIIYGGDFNADYNHDPTHVENVLHAMDATAPEVVGDLKTTYDRKDNTIIGPNPNGKQSYIDYVVYINSHLHPITSSMEVVRLTDDPFWICDRGMLRVMRHTYPWSEQCRSNRSIIDLSDHYSVLGTFDFPLEAPDDPEDPPRCDPISAAQHLVAKATIPVLFLILPYFFTSGL
ncbi:sphingomyelinase C-like [Glandiceps talaboti]